MAARKRGFGEQERTKLWAEMVGEEIVATGISRKRLKGRALGEKIEEKANELAKELNLPREDKNKLPTAEAWRWYQGGGRTPRKTVRDAVDIVLTKSGGRPVGWIVAGPGEVELAPVWAWPAISHSGLPKEEALKCAEMEKIFWQKIPEGIAVIDKAVKCGIIPLFHWLIYLEENKQITWPPRILLPVEISNILPKEDSADFPYLASRPGYITKYVATDQKEEDMLSTKELLEIYREWTNSPSSAKADGEDWFNRIRCLPFSPFHDSWDSTKDVQLLNQAAERKVNDEIRDYFNVTNPPTY